MNDKKKCFSLAAAILATFLLQIPSLASEELRPYLTLKEMLIYLLHVSNA